MVVNCLQDIHLISSCWSHANFLLLLFFFFFINTQFSSWIAQWEPSRGTKNQLFNEQVSIFSWITVLISCRPWSTHSLFYYLFRNPMLDGPSNGLAAAFILYSFYHFEHNLKILNVLWFHQAIGLLNNTKGIKIKINFVLKIMRKLEEFTLILS